MDCSNCKERTTQEEPVPFQAHESDMARMESIIKRLVVLLILMTVLLVGSNAAWIWYEAQFTEEEWSFEATTDGGGNAIANGDGEVFYYGQSEGDAYAPDP